MEVVSGFVDKSEGLTAPVIRALPGIIRGVRRVEVGTSGKRAYISVEIAGTLYKVILGNNGPTINIDTRFAIDDGVVIQIPSKVWVIW
jgi:hypothetical protein